MKFSNCRRILDIYSQGLLNDWPPCNVTKQNIYLIIEIETIIHSCLDTISSYYPKALEADSSFLIN